MNTYKLKFLDKVLALEKFPISVSYMEKRPSDKTPFGTDVSNVSFEGAYLDKSKSLSELGEEVEKIPNVYGFNANVRHVPRHNKNSKKLGTLRLFTKIESASHKHKYSTHSLYFLTEAQYVYVYELDPITREFVFCTTKGRLRARFTLDII